MKSPFRPVLACVLGATLFVAAAARAEKVFTVNENNTGLFDQPSATASGGAVHVSFIGDTTGGGYKVYYAAISGGADFQNVLLQRDNTVILTPAATVDNTDAGNDPYVDARHPKIAVRSASEVVILFQAKPASTADTAYRLYMARLMLSGNTVVQRSVRQVQGLSSGTIEDVSWALLAADGTARIAYATRSAIDAAEPFQIVFARVGIDNATAAAPIAVTASFPSSLGFRPLPSLKLDEVNREHIAWVASGAPGATSGPVYYAMIDQTGGIDNMLIAPTAIMTLYETGYTFPSVMVINQNLLTVLAGDEVTGALSYVQLNPNAANNNGQPGLDNIANNNLFLLVPPGEPILPETFRVFRPEALYEPGSERIFVTGYPTLDNVTGGKFIAFTVNAPISSADLAWAPSSFAKVEIPFTGLPGDYTQLAFGFPGGKIMAFWPSALAGGNRNLEVTTVPTVAAWISSNESGCAVVADPSRGAAGRVPGTLLLFLPAALLAARRILATRAQRPACAPATGARGSAGRTIGR